MITITILPQFGPGVLQYLTILLAQLPYGSATDTGQGGHMMCDMAVAVDADGRSKWAHWQLLELAFRSLVPCPSESCLDFTGKVWVSVSLQTDPYHNYVVYTIVGFLRTFRLYVDSILSMSLHNNNQYSKDKVNSVGAVLNTCLKWGVWCHTLRFMRKILCCLDGREHEALPGQRQKHLEECLCTGYKHSEIWWTLAWNMHPFLIHVTNLHGIFVLTLQMLWPQNWLTVCKPFSM